jgi:hypothetical protein
MRMAAPELWQARHWPSFSIGLGVRWPVQWCLYRVVSVPCRALWAGRRVYGRMPMYYAPGHNRCRSIVGLRHGLNLDHFPFFLALNFLRT